ncbi:MAG: sigma-54-dependent transcriptional regulator [Candidatus Binatia bacterium]
MTNHKILVVDDDPLICRQLDDLFTERKHRVECAADADQAMELLSECEFALAIVDLKIPGTDGLSLTRQMHERWPDLDVIIITGYASIKGAVEAIRHGANDYITKPFEREEILLAADKVLEKRRLIDEISYLRDQLCDRYSFANMVSRNAAMHEIFQTIEALAQNDATVLISGESGTGKELVARAAHFQGRRRNGRFVAINCAAFPDTLLESELFGYERGAFTGAVGDRVGKIELSSGGTLFLDEVESVSLSMQLKLLRVLEQREIEKLGGNRLVKVNMRVITATNRDLAEMVENGTMREDFYYRINVIPVRIPPLRERIEDIPLLVNDMLSSNAMAKERNIQRVSNKTLQTLMSYHWPGNIRELRNVVERAILKSKGPALDGVDLGDSCLAGANLSTGKGASAASFQQPLREYLRRAEREYLSELLRRNRGAIATTAGQAMIDAATLHRKMKAHGLKREDFKSDTRSRSSRAELQ